MVVPRDTIQQIKVWLLEGAVTLQSTQRPVNQPAQSSTKLCPPTTYTQQQPPPDCLTGVLAFILTFGLSLAAVAGPIRFFISAAIVTNACSTLVALFALVSRNGMRSWSAYSYNYNTVNCHWHTTSQTVTPVVAEWPISLAATSGW